MSLKELRSRIKSVKSTQKITSAMKMVSSAKLKRVQDKTNNCLTYLKSLDKIGYYLGKLIQDTEKLPAWFNDKGDDLIIIFGAEKGLCGNFHSNILRKALRFIDEMPGAKILAFGKKIKENLYKEYNERFFNFDTDIKELNLRDFLKLANYLESEKALGKISNIHIVGSHFKNVLNQEIYNKKLLPFEFENTSDTTIFEPCADEFLPYFYNQYVSAKLYHAWIDTQTCEIASRMSAMDNATRNASEMIDNLSLIYNRTRQAKITTELIEIISGSQSVNN